MKIIAPNFFWLLLAIVLLVFPACSSKEPPPEQSSPPEQPTVLPNVPLYPSGRVLERAYSPDGSFQVRLLTTASQHDILVFYERRLKQLGWRREGELDQENYLAIYRKGQKLIHLSVLPTDDPEEVIHILSYKE